MSQSVILVVNKSETYHRDCPDVVEKYGMAYCSPEDTECPRCGQTFNTISSDYDGLARYLTLLRSDLEPDFPWEGFYSSEDGQMLLAELQTQGLQEPNENEQP